MALDFIPFGPTPAACANTWVISHSIRLGCFNFYTLFFYLTLNRWHDGKCAKVSPLHIHSANMLLKRPRIAPWVNQCLICVILLETSTPCHHPMPAMCHYLPLPPVNEGHHLILGPDHVHEVVRSKDFIIMLLLANDSHHSILVHSCGRAGKVLESTLILLGVDLLADHWLSKNELFMFFLDSVGSGCINNDPFHLARIQISLLNQFLGVGIASPSVVMLILLHWRAQCWHSLNACNGGYFLSSPKSLLWRVSLQASLPEAECLGLGSVVRGHI